MKYILHGYRLFSSIRSKAISRITINRKELCIHTYTVTGTFVFSVLAKSPVSKIKK